VSRSLWLRLLRDILQRDKAVPSSDTDLGCSPVCVRSTGEGSDVAGLCGPTALLLVKAWAPGVKCLRRCRGHGAGRQGAPLLQAFGASGLRRHNNVLTDAVATSKQVNLTNYLKQNSLAEERLNDRNIFTLDGKGLNAFVAALDAPSVGIRASNASFVNRQFSARKASRKRITLYQGLNPS
jgi:uncharacterized protein (DUF1778 family)